MASHGPWARERESHKQRNVVGGILEPLTQRTKKTLLWSAPCKQPPQHGTAAMGVYLNVAKLRGQKHCNAAPRGAKSKRAPTGRTQSGDCSAPPPHASTIQGTKSNRPPGDTKLCRRKNDRRVEGCYGTENNASYMRGHRRLHQAKGTRSETDTNQKDNALPFTSPGCWSRTGLRGTGRNKR